LTASSGVITDVPGEYGYSSKCLWLIKAQQPNTIIELSVEQFASTCTCYTLYIYNGASFRAPLLAAYSGSVRHNCSTITSPVQRLWSASRTVLIYFFRDSNNVHSGFKIKYSILRDCSTLCSYHGNCNAVGKCICSPGWTGPTCNTSICPYSCIYGICNVVTSQCDCEAGFAGPSCNTSSKYGSWNKHIALNQDVAQGRAAHGVGVIGDWLWVYGGYSLTDKPFNNLVRYSFSRNIWEIVVSSSNSSDEPSSRYGHSLVVYNNSLIIFGGIVKGRTVNELWSFSVITRLWTSKASSVPMPVSGHTATIVNTKMIVLFGYGPMFGFTPCIQEYDIVTNKWKIVKLTMKEGTYGHTSLYDPITKLIYIHGGRSKNGYSDMLYSYNPVTNHWNHLSRSKSMYLFHSAVLVGHMMLVYGRFPSDNKCNDTHFMAYHIICNKWTKMPQTNLPHLSGGLGYAAVVYNSKMYIFGGFNGVVKNDLLSYSLGNCSLWNDKTSCLSANSISGCSWDPLTKNCLSPAISFPRLNSVKHPTCTGDACQKYVWLNETYKNCFNCLKPRQDKESHNTYMWCNAQKKCISTDSYAALFPNGQCNNWIINSCQACQCNGHSICMRGKSCSHCKHHTTGRLCQYCEPGYHGDTRNGGTCRECQCNGHAKHCHQITSKCDCLTEGIIGDKCESCDEDFEGNATNGRMCYYQLQINMKKVFNISGKTGLNIQFSPLLKDHDLAFEIEVVSGPSARINITFLKELSKHRKKEELVLKSYKLGRLNHKFSHRDYSFHKGHISFRAYIYKMDKSVSLQITAHFHQPSTLNINLLEFFLTFFGCFLSLLFVASIGWRIRSRYHSYLVTRQRRAERDRMANRPFAIVHLLLPHHLEVLSKSSPSPVAMEPLAINKVAIATVVVLLPEGEEGVTPVGQCGVCFGSMLMAHGSHQHSCLRARRMGRKKNKKHATMTTYQL
ncbi:hypothetical protein QZH41_009102, partial [Actinostola sp. cb2023]